MGDFQTAIFNPILSTAPTSRLIGLVIAFGICLNASLEPCAFLGGNCS